MHGRALSVLERLPRTDDERLRAFCQRADAKRGFITCKYCGVTDEYTLTSF